MMNHNNEGYLSPENNKSYTHNVISFTKQDFREWCASFKSDCILGFMSDIQLSPISSYLKILGCNQISQDTNWIYCTRVMDGQKQVLEQKIWILEFHKRLRELCEKRGSHAIQAFICVELLDTITFDV